MYIFDRIDEYDRKEKWVRWEFEILTRLDITGVFDIGCICCQQWEFASIPEGSKDVRAYYLQINGREANLEIVKSEKTLSEKQYYLPGYIQSELAILFTLFTGAHFVISRLLKSADQPNLVRYASHNDVASTDVDGRSFSFKFFEDRFELLKALQLRENENGKNRIEPFMLAARMYHTAISFLHKDHTLAYIHLVSAIEALLHDYDPGCVTLDDVNSDASKILHEYLTEDQYSKVESALLRPLPKIANRFVKFIGEYLPDEYWHEEHRPIYHWQRFNNANEVAIYADRIYKARSKSLHEGCAFPPDYDMGNERPVGVGIQSGDKVWDEKDMLPPVRAFERIVHHVLMEYLKREAAIAVASSDSESDGCSQS